jgi:hypothetical protein
MLASDFGRRFIMTVAASGHVYIHERGRRAEPGTLPVFTTDTREQAEAIRVRHCKFASDGSGLYRLNDPPGNVDQLSDVSDLFRSAFILLVGAPEADRMGVGR